MSSRGKGRRRLLMAARASRQSKAAIAVDIHSQHEVVCESIKSLSVTAATILDYEKPTKRVHRELLDTADTILSLQSDVQQAIPKLMPSNFTKCAVGRLQYESNRVHKTDENESAPCDNLRARLFHLCGHAITLPENRSQYTAIEVCAILHEVQADIDDMPIRNSKGISINKVIDAMIN